MPIDLLLIAHVESSYMKTDVEVQSLQKDENRTHSIDSSKAYSSPRAFNCWLQRSIF